VTRWACSAGSTLLANSWIWFMNISCGIAPRFMWLKGIYMGADSTNPEAIKRNRPSA
jgi:hypothetical protein